MKATLINIQKDINEIVYSILFVMTSSLKSSLFYMFSVLVFSLQPAISSFLIMGLFDRLASGLDYTATIKQLVYIFVFGLVLKIISLIKNITRENLQHNYELKIMEELTSKVNGLKPEIVFQRFVQDELSRAKDNHNMYITIFDSTVSIFQSILMILSVIIYIYSINPILALYFSLSILLYSVLLHRQGRRKYEMKKEITNDLKYMGYLSGIMTKIEYAKELRVFKFAEYILERINQLSAKTYEKYYRHIFKQNLLTTYNQLANYLFYGACYLVVGLLIMKGALSVGMLGGTMAILIGVDFALKNYSRFVIDLFEGINQSYSLKRIIDNNSYKKANMTNTYKDAKHSIELHNIGFSYIGNDGQMTLKEVSFKIHKNELVLIVGENGSGKSTLLKILAGLFECTEGSLNISPGKITYIGQDFTRYNVSFWENILFDRSVDKETLNQLMTDLDMREMVDQFDQESIAVLGRSFGDVDLSGGQWAKINIARGLVNMNSELVLMDEPTANLDLRSEKIVNDYIHNMNKTRVIVTHNLGLATRADKIIVMDAGRVIEMGSHDELLSKNGLYHNLFTSKLSNIG